jgi:putative PIN family toxin of toxin-antitoxin system
MGKLPPKIIVVDTNVLIRATFRKRSPVSLRIYQTIKDQTCILATSPAILAEIREVISRDYIIALTHMTPEQRTSYMNELRDISMLTKGQAALTQKSRDRKDNKFGSLPTLRLTYRIENQEIIVILTYAGFLAKCWTNLFPSRRNPTHGF